MRTQRWSARSTITASICAKAPTRATPRSAASAQGRLEEVARAYRDLRDSHADPNPQELASWCATFRVEAEGSTTLSHEHDAFCLWQPGEQAPGELTESAADLLAFAEAA